MKTFIRFLEVDQMIQAILFVLTGLSVFTIIGLMFTLPLLGAWQLFSGIVKYNKLKDKPHLNYLYRCAGVLSGMAVTMYVPTLMESFVLLLLFIIIPVIMALQYFNLTMTTIIHVKQHYEEPIELQEDLLDDEFVFI